MTENLRTPNEDPFSSQDGPGNMAPIEGSANLSSGEGVAASQENVSANPEASPPAVPYRDTPPRQAPERPADARSMEEIFQAMEERSRAKEDRRWLERYAAESARMNQILSDPAYARTPTPRLASWGERIRSHPAVTKVFGEQKQGYKDDLSHIMGVGLEKAVGYLGISRIQELGGNVRQVVQDLQARGVVVRASGHLLYAYDPRALSQLLQMPANSAILDKYNLSHEPNDFVNLIMYFDVRSKTDLYTLIADTFNNKTGLGRTDARSLSENEQRDANRGFLPGQVIRSKFY